MHREIGQRPPGSADQIQRSADDAWHNAAGCNCFLDRLAERGIAIPAHGGQAQGAQRQADRRRGNCHPRSRPVRGCRRQDRPQRRARRERRRSRRGRDTALLPRRESTRGSSPSARTLLDEFRAVAGIARRGGGHGLDVADAEIARIAAKRASPASAMFIASVGMVRCSAMSRPSRAVTFSLSHTLGARRGPRIDDQPHGVRADVDDRAIGHCRHQAHRCAVPPYARHAAPLRSAAWARGSSFNAPPRPDSEGLVMK